MMIQTKFVTARIEGPSLRFMKVGNVKQAQLVLCSTCQSQVKEEGRLPPTKMCLKCAPYWWELCRVSGKPKDTVIRRDYIGKEKNDG